jgi:hypothetical protein
MEIQPVAVLLGKRGYDGFAPSVSLVLVGFSVCLRFKLNWLEYICVCLEILCSPPADY